MNYNEQSDKLAGPIGLLKQYEHPVHSHLLQLLLTFHRHRFITRTGRESAEDATQIFGGRGMTQSGMGKLVENVSNIPSCAVIWC